MSKETAPICFVFLAFAFGMLASCRGEGVSSYPVAVTVKHLQGILALSKGSGLALSIGPEVLQ